MTGHGSRRQLFARWQNYSWRERSGPITSIECRTVTRMVPSSLRQIAPYTERHSWSVVTAIGIPSAAACPVKGNLPESHRQLSPIHIATHEAVRTREISVMERDVD